MHLKTSSVKWRQFCLDLNVLKKAVITYKKLSSTNGLQGKYKYLWTIFYSSDSVDCDSLKIPEFNSNIKNIPR